MENETVLNLLTQLADRHVCDDCADTLLAILDRISAQRASRVVPMIPAPRRETAPIAPTMLAALRASIPPTRSLA